MSKTIYVLAADIEPGLVSDLSRFLLDTCLEPEREIELFITSPGGDIDCAFAVYDTIRTIPNKVTTIASGQASSAATVVFLAGDNRLIMPNALIRLHTPGFFSDSGGRFSLQDIESKHKNLKSIFDHLLRVSAERTGQSVKVLRNLCRRAKHLSAEEAVKYGFAHQIGYLPKETP